MRMLLLLTWLLCAPPLVLAATVVPYVCPYTAPLDCILDENNLPYQSSAGGWTNTTTNTTTVLLVFINSNLTVDEDATVGNDFFVRDDLNVTDDVLVGDDLQVNDNLDVDGDFDTDGNADVGDNLTVRDFAEFRKNITGWANANFDGFVNADSFGAGGLTNPARVIEAEDFSGPQLRLSHAAGATYTDFRTTIQGELFINATGNNVGIGTEDPGEPLEVAGDMNSTGGDICITGGTCLSEALTSTAYQSSAGGWYNDTSETNTDLDVNLTTGNLYVSNGLVGIGTDSPGGLLHVSGGKLVMDNGQRIDFYDAEGNLRQVFKVDAYNNTNIGSTNLDNLLLQAGEQVRITAGGAEAIRILDTGSVGIGDTSADARLDVVASGTAGLRVEGDGSNNIAEFSNSTDVVVVIDELGNVGIGATNPSYTFHVEGKQLLRNTDGASTLIFDAADPSNTVSAFMLYREVGVNKYGLIYAQSTEDFYLYDYDNTDFVWRYDKSERNFGFQSGDVKVGIGEIGPDFTLELINNSANGAFGISSTASGDGDLLTFDESGFLGIGTTNPDTELEVDGTITSSNQLFSAYDAAGGITIGTSWTNITWDTTNRNDTLFDFSTDDDEITITIAGDYIIAYSCTADSADASSRLHSDWRLIVNEVEVGGTYRSTYHRIDTDGRGTAAMAPLLYTFSANDVLTLQGMSDDASDITTVANGCNIYVERK